MTENFEHIDELFRSKLSDAQIEMIQDEYDQAANAATTRNMTPYEAFGVAEDYIEERTKNSSYHIPEEYFGLSKNGSRICQESGRT